MADAADGSLINYWAHGPKGTIGDRKQYTEGRPSDHPVGVMYNAPWEALADGFAEHARRCARALATTGCPVHLRSLTPHLVPGDEEQEQWLYRNFGDLAHASIGRYSVQCHQVVPTEGLLYSMVRHRFLTDEEMRAVNCTRVISTVWERSPVPAPDVDALNQVGQAWVACHANADLLASWGVTTPIRIVPVPFYPNDPHLRLRGRTRRPGPPRFYHIGKWEPRKAQDQIVRAFLRAFQPGEAELYVKTSQFAPDLPEYPEPTHCVRGIVENDAQVKANGWTLTNTMPQAVKIFQAKLPDTQLVALHGLGDVYVTLSRGEGFDMPAFDAKLSRNRMIYTPSGGPQDYAHATDYLVPTNGRVPCPVFYKWGDGATYLDFDVDAAADAMRHARADVLWGHAHEPVDASPYDRFTLAHVGQQMLGYLQELTPEVFR